MRFIRLEHTQARVKSQGSIVSAVERYPVEADSPLFLSRLWALFGVPSYVSTDSDGVFIYDLEDTQTGLYFTAFVTNSGPHYGGRDEDHEALLTVLDAFEQVLSNSPLVDCEIVQGNGRLRYGVKNGQPFWEEVVDGE